MKRYLYLLMIAIWAWNTKAMAQADISMTTHWYNRANYNPASIARTHYLYLFSNIRQQWAGVSGAPKVFNVQASEYVHDMHSAFGLSMVGDKLGVTQSLNPMLTYAYRLANNTDWSLAMGLSAGVFTRFVDGALFEAETDSDPSLQYNTEKILRPDANAGVEFQSSSFIFGISSTHLLSTTRSTSLLLNTNHRYGYAIYKNTHSELYNYNIGLQVVNRYNLTVVEANATVRFKHPTGLVKGPKEIFDLGLTLRTSKQMTLLFGMNVSRDLRVGYAYDQSFISGYYRNGTHELMLEYRIPTKAASTNFKCGNTEYWYH